MIAWHLLSDPGARFTDLGPDWHDRLAPIRRKRRLVAELERLTGKTVTFQEAAAWHTRYHNPAALDLSARAAARQANHRFSIQPSDAME